MAVTQPSPKDPTAQRIPVQVALAEHKPLEAGQWMVLIAAFLGWMFDGVELGLFPIAARPALQDLMPGASEAVIGQWVSYLTAVFLLGAAVGGLAFGWLGDRIGRVRSMTLSIVAYSSFTGLCYFAAAPWELGVFRFLAALGMGGEWALGVALVMECWPERHRPLLAGVIGAAANVGMLLIALVGIAFAVTSDSWRWIMMAGAAPGLLALFVILFVPESKRWQQSAQKAKTNPIREVLTPPLLKPTILAIIISSVALIGTWGAVSAFLPTWADQLAGEDNPRAKALVQAMIAFGCTVGCLIGPFVSNRIGRRGGYFALCVGAFAVTQFMFRCLHTYDLTFIFFSFLAGMLASSFYGLLPLYLPELYPTRVRATGQGLSFNTGRILAAGGALSTGWLIATLGGYPQACAAITFVYLIGMVVIWFAPETRGKPLPD
jgi:MFS family permease